MNKLFVLVTEQQQRADAAAKEAKWKGRAARSENEKVNRNSSIPIYLIS